MVKLSSSLVKNRPRFKGAYLKALGGKDMEFNMDAKTHVTADGLLFFHAGNGLELKYMEKGEIVLPRDDFSHLRKCFRNARLKNKRFRNTFDKR
jgi:hypothetical protein